MATPKKTQIVITANAAVAKKVMDELQQRIDQIKAKMKGLDVTTKEGQREFKKLEKELVSYNSAVSQNITNTERIKKAMDNLSKTSLNELKRALSAAKSELGKMSASDPKLKQMQGNVKALQQQIDKLTGSVKNNGGAWKTAVKNLTAYVGLSAVFNKIKDTVPGAIKKNFDYSASLTDIRKVSGMTAKDINELSNRLAKIDTRTSVDGLAQLAYQGAKLGMSKYGIGGMEQFVRAADQINVSIGEEMGEEALPALAKMVETMGLIPKMGIEKAILATGSAMFKLSTTSTSTSSNITEFARRLTGVARTAGITTDQILAMGSAFDSQMASPEVASTAMSKFIVALQKNHNLIEKDLGIPDDTIKKMYAAGHAMDAIVMVLEKMRDKGNMNALGGIFKDMGGDGQRLISSMVTMSKNVDMLKDHLVESEEAFEEASAVTAEYNMQQESAIGILDRANNLWEKAFVNPTGVNTVKDLAQAWYDISSVMTNSPLFNGTLHAALNTLVLSAQLLVKLLPAIINFAVSRGIWSAVTFFWDMGKAIRGAVVAQQSLNAAMKANIFGTIASVVLTAVGAIWAYANAAKEAARAEEEAERRANAWKNKLHDAQVETDTLTKKLHSYMTALEQTGLSQKRREQEIAHFNKEFRSYINKLDIEVKSVKDLKQHYNELATEIQRATYYRLREEAKADAMPKYQKERLAAENAVKKRLKFNSDYSGFSSKSIMEMFARGANAEWIYQQIMLGSNPKLAKNKDRVTFDRDKEGKFDGYWTWDLGNGSRARGGDKVLLSNLRWYQNATRRELNKQKEIDDYFGDFVPEGYHPWVDDEPGTLDNDATRNGKGRKGKTNNDKNIAKDRANALLANIQAFYEEQRRKFFDWVSQMNESGEKVSEGYVKAFLSKLQEHEETATGLARQSIATAGKEWDDFHKQITDDQFQTATETDKRLLTAIDKANVQELHKLFEKLGQNLAKENHKTLAENLGALLDEIFKNGSRDMKKAAEEIMKRQYELQRMLSEMDYVGTVQRESRSSWDENQLLPAANGIDTNTEEGQAQMAASFEALTKKIRENLLALSEFDVRTKEGRDAFVAYLSDDEIKKGFDFQKLSILQIQALWVELYKYPDKYTEAEKRSYDLAKKLIEHRWKMNGMSKDQESRQSLADQKKRMYPDQHGFGSRLGFADQKYDPEVEGYKLKLQFAQEYYDFVLTHSKNAQLQQEAQMSLLQAQNDLVEGMVKAMQERMDKVKDFAQPIVDFGSAAGEALAQFRDDVESAQEALKQAAKSMLKSWGEMMINDLTAQTMQGMKNGMAVKVVKGSPTANTTAENAVEGAKSGANELNDQAIADMQVAIQEGKYAKVYEIEAAYQEKSLEQWKAYADFKSQILGEDLASSPNDTPLMLRKQEEADAMLAQEQAQIDASLDLQKMKQTAINKAIEQGGKRQIKVQDKTNKTIAKNEAKAQKDILSDTKETEEQKSDIIDVSGQAQVAAAQFMNSKILSTQKATNEERVQEDAATTQKETTLSIVEAMAKCFAFLGPIAGPITAGVIQALLMGLLNWALSSAFGSKKSGKSSNDKGPNTKLVTGMLTYDEGNVSDMQPYVGDNGNVYWATEDNSKHTGVNLLTRPTATTINGQPSLVAENGPELVIGRETTKAMMMNHPALMKALFSLDSRHSGRRTFDEGNVGEAIGGAPDASAAGNAAHDAQMMVLMSAILDRLNNPVPPEINMYGEGGLHHKMQQANQFMKGK